MKKQLIIIPLLAMGTTIVHADDGNESPYTLEECRQLVISHRANDSVSYHAGVDVKGNPVVPADLTPPKSYGLDQGIEIDLSAPYGGGGGHRSHHGAHHHQEHAGPSSQGSHHHHNHDRGYGQNNWVSPGYAIIGPDGQVSINGETVGDDEAMRIANECRDLYPDL